MPQGQGLPRITIPAGFFFNNVCLYKFYLGSCQRVSMPLDRGPAYSLTPHDNFIYAYIVAEMNIQMWIFISVKVKN